MSVCSLLIKEFCGGKAGWNDRAILSETDLKPAPKPVWPHSGIHISMAKFCPMLYQNSSWAFDLRKSAINHPTFSACLGLFKVPLPAPTYFFQLVTLVDWGSFYQGKQGLVCSPPLWNTTFVLPNSTDVTSQSLQPKVDRMVSLSLYRNIYMKSAPNLFL